MGVGLSNKPKVGAIIQARMQSSRLPGKILFPLPFNSNRALLSWPIERLKRSNYIDTIILATSINEENAILKAFAEQNQIDFFAGSEDDVLSRFVEAANMHELDVIVRVTGDNPIIDETLIDELIDLHINQNVSYSYSTNLPIGMNVEIVNVNTLREISVREDLLDSDKEHVTYFFKRNKFYPIYQHHFQVGTTNSIRLTVDYAADYAMMDIVAQISNIHHLFGVPLIRFISENYGWVFQINTHLFQKKQYASFDEEKMDATNLLKQNELFFTIDTLQKISIL